MRMLMNYKYHLVWHRFFLIYKIAKTPYRIFRRLTIYMGMPAPSKSKNKLMKEEKK